MLSEKFTQDSGGKQASTLVQWKKELIADVSDARTSIESDITTNVWIQTVIKAILKKSRIDTIGEYREIRKQVFEENKFNLVSGQLN